MSSLQRIVRWDGIYGLKNRHIRCCDRFFAVQHFLWRAREEHLAAHGTAARTEFDEVVAGFQHFQVVLDEEDGVAHLHHGVEKVEDALDVVEVETIGRLVHDEDFGLLKC